MKTHNLTRYFLIITSFIPFRCLGMNQYALVYSYLHRTVYDTYLTLGNNHNQIIYTPQPHYNNGLEAEYIPSSRINSFTIAHLTFYPIKITPLMKAIGENDLEQVKKLLKNESNPQEKSALHRALF